MFTRRQLADNSQTTRRQLADNSKTIYFTNPTIYNNGNCNTQFKSSIPNESY